MAIVVFLTTPISRTQGRNAVAQAAYISRSRLQHFDAGRTYDERGRGGLEHAEILLPSGAPPGADWARDRSALWNAAERAEHRRNSRVAREYVVALPHELNRDARLQLALDFARHLADRHGAVLDLAVHNPTAGSDPRHFHAHLLATTREVNAHGLGAKNVMERTNADRKALGLLPQPLELRALRGLWTERANEFLAQAGLDIRLDPRPLREQGLDRVPQLRLPAAIFHLERKIGPVAAGDRLREQHSVRYARALERHRAASPALAGPAPPEAAAPALEPERPQEHTEPVAHRAPLSPLEHHRQAVERWLAYRKAHANDRARGAETARERGHDRGADFEP